MRKANPEKRGYVPLLVIHPLDVRIGRFLGWIHETLEPIWVSADQTHWYQAGEVRDECGCFTVPDDMESQNGEEYHPLRIVTRKGCPADAFMIASDFVRDAFMLALSRPFARVVSVPTSQGVRDLRVWRLTHTLPASSQEMYVAFEWDVPQDPDTTTFIKYLVEHRDEAYDRVLRDKAGQMRSMVEATRGLGDTKHRA